MSHTLTETGKVLTETQEGVTMPADYSFATVNDYMHGIDRNFEELQWLCIGMATEIDKLRDVSPVSNDASESAKVAVASVAVLGCWLPIETAPKNGERVLAYTNDGYKWPLVCQCVFDDAWWPDVWESPQHPINPTHWMPLPDFPPNA